MPYHSFAGFDGGTLGSPRGGAVERSETERGVWATFPTVSTISTVSRYPYEKHETHDFNEITISRYPPKSTKSTKSTKSRFHGPPTESRKQRNPRKKTKRPEKRRFVVFVVYGENVGFVETLPKLPSQSRFARQLPRRGSQAYRRQTRRTSGKAKRCAPLSVSFADSSPTGGAKRTAVKPGKRRVRRSCEQVCLTTA